MAVDIEGQRVRALEVLGMLAACAGTIGTDIFDVTGHDASFD
jgi:hypothetical protein